MRSFSQFGVTAGPGVKIESGSGKSERFSINNGVGNAVDSEVIYDNC
jgi:hypothetical protein